ncbi:hypothetical protein ARALYDRAFT_338347 [Arabidopsis lyrata subsp. lyrata]|uniref:B box-type domain-containing protein n=1 Tax=Arabidopsis lyrata subsp. lyrata TaxID=81972 RepID=D7KXB0_ARALL|nr:hypothetical protein ARALYDRAFT_338347 [Arabidopsis lyrata subsp. lyrata]
MAQVCHTCRHVKAVIRCVTETLNYCLTCDYLHHCNNLHAGHVRYQLCDNCTINPSILLCYEDGKALCQSCYSTHYNCAPNGHHIQIVRRIQYPNNNTQHHDHAHMPHVVDHNNNNNRQQHHQEHVQHEGGHQQRRAGMFERSCHGDNNCERWMFAMGCELCLASSSNAVVYCSAHNKLLCDDCDRMTHIQEATVPPHSRCKLCVNCKRPSSKFLIGGYHFNFPRVHPPAAEEIPASPPRELPQQDINGFQDDDDDFSWFEFSWGFNSRCIIAFR